jgi:hypothetical protein
MKENASKLEVQRNMILNNKKKKTMSKSPKKNIKTSCKKKIDNEQKKNAHGNNSNTWLYNMMF